MRPIGLPNPAILAACLLGAVSSSVRGQIPGRALNEPKPESAARTLWKAELAVPPTARFTVLPDRVAVLAPAGDALQIHDTTGALIERVALPGPLDGIAASPRGDRLLGVLSIDEDRFRHTVLGIDGSLVWSRTVGSPLRFSPSGDFLLTRHDALDASQPPTAFRARDGEVAWTDDENPVYWSLDASADNRLAYYRPGLLRLIELPTGRSLWERTVPADEAHDFGEVILSLSGDTVVIRTRLEAEHGEKRLTRVYDGSGGLLWERLSERGAGETEGRIAAVSSDGSLLARLDPAGLSILNAADGRVVDRIEGRRLCCVTAFTDEMLALSRPRESRVYRLRRGALQGAVRFSEPVRFVFRADAGSGPGIPAPGTGGRYLAIVGRPSASGISVAPLDFSLWRPEPGPRD